jgi:zinc D-Ala-D-Ala carboxypeptidase
MATSTHFSSAELSCRDGCGLNNVKLELLAKLEQARVILGIPLIIDSGSRCPKHELEVSGKSNGEHTTGEAVDIRCLADRTRFNIIRTFIELGICRIGNGPNFIHIGISDTLPAGVFWNYYE